MTTDFQKLLVKISKILNGFKIPYIITGGFAASFWGRRRSTADVDVVIELLPEQVKNLHNALKKISEVAYVDEEVMHEAIRRQSEFNFIHPESGIKFDFFVKRDPIFRNELRRRIAVKIGATNVFFISPEDLILSKLRWYQKSQSDRHLEDANSIIKKQKKLEKKYLQNQAVIQSCADELRNLLKQKN